jgi:predicted ATP-grasp superfamily ATP-dependent carboligase
LNKYKIQYPRVIVPRKRSDLSLAGKEFDYPIFVRPCMAQTFYDAMGRKGFLAASESELANYCRISAEAGLDVILQEFIPGPASDIFSIAGYFDSYSRPLALFGYRRLREWPPVIANSCLTESVPLSPFRNVVDPLLKYLVDIGYRGIMQATFKRDPRDGAYRILEVNARSWTHNSFPTKCGLNIVWKAYLDSIGLDGSYTEDYSVGVKWINILEDLAASVTAGEIMKPSWMKSLVGVKDYAFFDPDDLAPALMGLPFNLGLIDPEQGALRPANIRRTLRRLTADSHSHITKESEKEALDTGTESMPQMKN